MLAKGESARQQISQATVVAWLNSCLVVCLEDSTERSESNPTLGNKE